MELFTWINTTLQPDDCTSETFFYDEMESQSGYCLPVIYLPFDTSDLSHWYDRGAILDFLCATKGEGQRLLDFGPGDGWPALLVAPFAAEVVGVDGSVKRVDVCTANARRMGITNARFIHVAPGCPLPFPDASFDGVMAASSIEQTPNPKAALRELYRVLRPGGRLRISYESLGVYRGGKEREADLSPIDEQSCWLTIYDRDILRERAVMYRLALDLSTQEAARAFAWDEQRPLFEALTVDLLQQLRANIRAARTCTLTHPSCQTFVHWLGEIGFTQVTPTHSGQWFAGQLFRQMPETGRPTDLAGLDALLSPLIKIVVQMPAPPSQPSGPDALITAVK